MSDRSNPASDAERDFLSGQYDRARQTLESLRTGPDGKTDIRIENNLIAAQSTNPVSTSYDASERLKAALALEGNMAAPGAPDIKIGTACALLNLAALYYHQCRFENSAALLWSMFQRAGGLAPRFTARLCFLLLDALLRCWDSHGCTVKLTPSRASRLSNITSAVLASLSESINIIGERAPDAPPSAVEAILLLKFDLYQSLVSAYLGQAETARPAVLLPALQAVRSIGGVEELRGERGPLSTCSLSGFGLMSPAEFQSTLFLQARVAFSNGDYPNCLHLLSATVGPLVTTDNLPATLETILSQSSNTTQSEPFIPTPTPATSELTDVNHIIGHMLYLNNVGCTHSRLGNKQLSCLYFGKALVELCKLESVVSSRSLTSVLSTTQVDDVLHNSAVAYLRNGSPELARQCLDHVSAPARGRPMHWLRRAETYIQQHNASTRKQTEQTNRTYSCYPQRFGKVYLRYPLPNKLNTTETQQPLREAIRCLLRALELAPIDSVLAQVDVSESNSIAALMRGMKGRSENTAPPSSKCGAAHTLSTEETTGMPASVATGESTQEDCLCDEFKESCHLKLAYVFLCAGEPLLALDSIRTALRTIKALTASGSFLFSMYAAEALCKTGDNAEASLLLEPSYLLIPSSWGSRCAKTDISGGKDSHTNSSSEVDWSSSPAWITDDTVAAMCADGLDLNCSDSTTAVTAGLVEAVVSTNRAVVMCVRGDLAAAQSLLRNILNTFPTYSPAIRNLVYVYVRRKDHSGAVQVLQKYCTQTKLF